jgi:hypothetical protein
MAYFRKTRAAAKPAPWLAWGGGKAAKTGLWGAKKAARAEGRLLRRALSSREPAGVRWSKYGAAALLGFLGGVLLGRLGAQGAREGDFGEEGFAAGVRQEEESSSTTSDTGDSEEHQEPGEENVTGAERGFSDPSAGPLIGEEHRREVAGVPEQPEEVEQRIRSEIGTDPRTTSMPRINVQVNDGVAELRGEAPSEEARRAAEEIARNTEGVREVRNLLTVNPEGPTRERRAGGEDG